VWRCAVIESNAKTSRLLHGDCADEQHLMVHSVARLRLFASVPLIDDPTGRGCVACGGRTTSTFAPPRTKIAMPSRDCGVAPLAACDNRR